MKEVRERYMAGCRRERGEEKDEKTKKKKNLYRQLNLLEKNGLLFVDFGKTFGDGKGEEIAWDLVGNCMELSFVD